MMLSPRCRVRISIGVNSPDYFEARPFSPDHGSCIGLRRAAVTQQSPPCETSRSAAFDPHATLMNVGSWAAHFVFYDALEGESLARSLWRRGIRVITIVKMHFHDSRIGKNDCRCRVRTAAPWIVPGRIGG
jgi:hypothetical protein